MERTTVFETERLRVRQLNNADAPALYAIFSHPEVMRYWSSLPWTSIGQAEELVAAAQEGYADESWFQWGIERKDADGVIGTCTLFHWHRGSRRAEMGYALGRPFWGQGYMHEALSGLVSHAFSTLNLNRLEADIDSRNRASARTLERLGFMREGEMRERWIVGEEISDTWFYGLLRREWRGNGNGG